MSRIIFHCDMNNFYASVECMLNPKLRGFPVAVGGEEENRHGIILAKNYEAKKYGIKTGETLWQAREKCKNLVIVPPHFENYLKYSKLAREIYSEYTDLIEPYGMDENWLDVTENSGIHDDGERLANEIRERIKRELGLTISIGVSFNKIFAKLGSDMKKPDAVTVIPKDRFREIVWNLPVGDLLGVGRATQKLLKNYGIETIGELANAPQSLLKEKMGKNGLLCIAYANGLDYSRVMNMDECYPIKSVGHGITAKEDLTNNEEVFNMMLSLSQDVGRRLIKYGFKAGGVAIDVRNNQLKHRTWQCGLRINTYSSLSIANEAFELFKRSYTWEYPIRSITVRAIELSPVDAEQQLDFFTNYESVLKKEKLEVTANEIRRRFGKYAVQPAILFSDIKKPTDREVSLVMPTGILH